MGSRLQGWCHRLVIRPLICGLCGLRVTHGDRLPRSGPAILVANHNSHFDTLALFALFSSEKAASLGSVVARDYFRAGSLIGWIARRLMGAVPVTRSWQPSEGDPLAGCSRALDSGKILVLYPEGTRGTPGRMSELKAGVAYLARRHPSVPVIPVTLSGMDRVLPKGAVVPLPLTVAAHVGRPRRWDGGDCREFMADLGAALVDALETSGESPALNCRP
ncbi:MAG TPA: lysophospholipid acyltransferase family protein [Stellaceae bacterium]|nr:lysophospholipid acyltransferase family protein [Stellaceae bacterium]